MSGNITFPFPLNTSNEPAEGSKGVSVTIPWSAGAANPYNINLLSQFNSGQFTTVQAVWVDNGTCPFPLIIFCEQQQQNIWVPQFSQGVYPLIAGQSPKFTVSQLTTNVGSNSSPPLGSTGLVFLNTPQIAWQQPVSTKQMQGNYATGVISAMAASTWTTLYGAVSLANMYRAVTSVQLAVGTSVATTATSAVTVYLAESTTATPFFSDITEVATGTVGVYFRSNLVNWSNPPLLAANTGIQCWSNPVIAGATIFVSATITFNFALIE